MDVRFISNLQSLTGNGVDKTLAYLQNNIKINLKIIKFKLKQKFLIGKYLKFGMLKAYVKRLNGSTIIDLKITYM